MSAANEPQPESDCFDLVYAHWAEQAIGRRLDPPSRERWDAIALRLILSEDPDRIRRYRRIEDNGPESFGTDVYELWRKMPSYTANLSVPSNDFRSYEVAHRGSMKRLMEAQGLGERYNSTVEAQRRIEAERKARARRAQSSIVLMGCMGLALIGVMVLTVAIIILLMYFTR